MNSFLINTFIKHPEDVKNADVREQYGMLGGTVGMCCNILMSIIKFIVGFLSGSIAFVSDGLHNMMDAAASIITLITFKFSNRPADNKHPFGHGRIEYLSGLTISVLIILIGAEMMKTSVGKILHPTNVAYTKWSFIVFVTSVIIQIWLSAFIRKIGNLIDSDAMRATGKDYMSDCIGTIAVLIGATIATVFHLQLDGFLGAMVSCFILYTGITSVYSTVQPLLGATPDKEFVQAVLKEVKSHEEILGVHDMVVHDYGPTRQMVSLHAEISYKMDILQAHELIDEIEQDIRTNCGCDITIHMDPIVEDDEETNHYKEMTAALVKEIESDLKIHDFRMVKGKNHSNVIFDVVLPYESQYDETEVVAAIQDKMKQKDASLRTVITVDRNYVM